MNGLFFPLMNSLFGMVHFRDASDRPWQTSPVAHSGSRRTLRRTLARYLRRFQAQFLLTKSAPRPPPSRALLGSITMRPRTSSLSCDLQFLRLSLLSESQTVPRSLPRFPLPLPETLIRSRTGTPLTGNPCPVSTTLTMRPLPLRARPGTGACLRRPSRSVKNPILQPRIQANGSTSSDSDPPPSQPPRPTIS